MEVVVLRRFGSRLSKRPVQRPNDVCAFRQPASDSPSPSAPRTRCSDRSDVGGYRSAQARRTTDLRMRRRRSPWVATLPTPIDRPHTRRTGPRSADRKRGFSDDQRGHKACSSSMLPPISLGCSCQRRRCTNSPPRQNRGDTDGDPSHFGVRPIGEAV